MSFGENLDELVERSTNELHAKHPSWERVRVQEVAHLVNGFAFKSSGFNESVGTPIVRIRDVTKGFPGTFYSGPIDDPKMTIIEDGQIAIGMDGDFNSSLWNGGKALLNQRVCTLDANQDFYSQRFLAYALPGYLRLINAHTSAVTVKHLSSLTVRDIPLPLPPLKEQQRIVEKLDTLFAELDKAEESLRQVQTLLARYRQSVLKAAVTGELTVDWRAERSGKLEGGHALLERILRSREDRWQGRGAYKEPRGPDTSRLRPLPKGWVWATLEQVGVVVSGHTPRGVGDLIALDGTFPWFKVSSMNELGNEVELCHSRWMFDDAGAKKAKLPVIPAGAIVFPKRGGAILTNKKRRMGCDGSIDLNLMAFVPSGIHGFIWAFFQLLDLRSIYDGSNVPQINYKDIAHIPIAIPSTEEEASVIAEIVDDQLVRIAELELALKAELSRSAALRQSILKDAFSGRLVPQDPNDEPASELLARIRAARDDRKNR